MPHWYPAILRTFIAGLIAIAFLLVESALLISIAPSAGWVIAVVAGSFLLGAVFGVAVSQWVRGLAFPAMGLLALSSILPAFIVDVPFWGHIVDLRQVEQIPSDVGVAGYIAPDWRIDTTRAQDERLRAGRSNRSYGTRRIAPLVDERWTPNEPVKIWLAGEIRDSGRVLLSNPMFWTEPGGEYVRLVGKDLSGAQLAAGRVAEKFGLMTAPEPLIVMRMPSFDRARANQMRSLLRAARFPFAGWVVLIGLAAMALAWRGRRATSRS
jgi:hypothetical protein